MTVPVELNNLILLLLVFSVRHVHENLRIINSLANCIYNFIDKFLLFSNVQPVFLENVPKSNKLKNYG